MIQRAGPAHPFALAAIHEAAFPPGEAWSVTMFAAQLGLPGMFALLDDRGGMILVRVAAGEAEILTLAVAPYARRRGLADRLVAHAAAACRDAGAAKLFLEVATGNEAARGLYRKAGFRQVGRRRRYYADGADALIMELDLTSAAPEDA